MKSAKYYKQSHHAPTSILVLSYTKNAILAIADTLSKYTKLINVNEYQYGLSKCDEALYHDHCYDVVCKRWVSKQKTWLEIRCFCRQKVLIFFCLSMKTCCGYSLEALLMNTHKIYFLEEKRHTCINQDSLHINP